MSHTVHCRKYDQELEGMARPPYPGPKGKKLYETVSKKAWLEWVGLQTMLINEKQLNVLDPSTKVFLDEQLEKFLSNEAVEKIEGYVPPSE
ncbi:Fe-S cluster biosynthesis and repair protein YggX [Sinobacterium caligoides]|uniref:Probable Fe(2+)-trafficking protein n=1 Tax=Sinobacterium caligoides TaxID=933926 RepID=A0A3N2DGH4_9GAMM|nr:oxidative damage protection protein [Sinobacterium caligoides]ROR98887.1 Fe-S cluster biosynthesis and repair protein YggX [Sinobacterium caligoides]